MSLLDDVSIVVTPNGYKAGELYAVVPVPTEGAEEVTNGDFATDSDWNKDTGWTISGGTANKTGSVASNFYQYSVFTSGERYKLTFDISNSNNGRLLVYIGGGSITEDITNASDGTYTFYGVADGVTMLFRNVDFEGSIDNVSVKEYTAADMDVTRATAATRVDEAGLVNYAEIIGSEEVTNGDFASGTTDWTVSNGAISIDNGRLKIDGTNGATAEQTVTAVIGKTYKVTYSFTLGTATIGALIITGGNYPTLNAPEGTNTFYTTATQTNLRVRPRIGTDGTMFVDNISVKEVTRDNVPRIDYTGGGCPHI